MQEKKKQDMADRAKELDEMGLDQADPEDIEAYQQSKQFDDITNDLRNKKSQGDLRIKQESDGGFLAQIGIREMSETRLTFRKIPFIIWFCGSLVTLTSLYLIYHLILGHYGVLFEGYREGHWWQYFISFLMLLFGFTIFYAGKVEQIIFDKQLGILSKVKTTIFCTRKVTDWSLDQIQNVRVFKRGHDGIQVMTIHYDIQIDFRDIPSTVVMNTQDEEKAIR